MSDRDLNLFEKSAATQEDVLAAKMAATFAGDLGHLMESPPRDNRGVLISRCRKCLRMVVVHVDGLVEGAALATRCDTESVKIGG